VFGTLREMASPIKTEGAISAPTPAPALGEHTEPILRDLLGYSTETIAALRAAGAFGRSEGREGGLPREVPG
jgi:crotonobetainyl-CoA:carnitine CoA-transferase CaiB-like acyl-CoA transferase